MKWASIAPKIPWAFFGITLPLFAVDLFRVPLPGGLRLPPPVIVAVFLAGIGFIRVLIHQKDVLIFQDGRFKLLILLLGLFLGWHFLGMARAEEFSWAFKEVAKLIVGVSVFGAMMTYACASNTKLELTIVFCLWGATFLLAFLIYQYAWVFHSPYLGISISEPTRANRNQLAWFLAVMLPYAAAYFFNGPGRFRGLVPLMVMVVAWLYTSSRGSWICGSLGMFWAVAFLNDRGIREKVRRGAILIVVFTAIVVLALVRFLPFIQIEDLDLLKRAGSLVSSQEMAEDYSYGVRKELVESTLEQYERNPVIGSGLTNSRIQHEFVSHNDVLGVLSELGFIGFLMFLVIISLILWMSLDLAPGNWIKSGSQGSILALTFYLVLINAYTTAAFWIAIYLAMTINQLADGKDPSCPMEGD